MLERLDSGCEINYLKGITLLTGLTVGTDLQVRPCLQLGRTWRSVPTKAV